jgi:hypothetical protein
LAAEALALPVGLDIGSFERLATNRRISQRDANLIT